VSRRRALFLSPEAPYPTIGGGALRSASILEYLARHYSVHAIVFGETGISVAQGPADKLDVIELPHHSRGSAARIARNSLRLIRNRPPLLDRFSGFESEMRARTIGQEYDVAVFEHFWSAGYVDRVGTKYAVLDLHNVESEWHRSLAGSEGTLRRFALNRFADASLAAEHRLFPKFDRILTTSLPDAALVERIVPGAPVTVYSNALPEFPAPPRLDRHEIVFSGNLEYQPNIGAVQFFHQRIWPQLRSRWPELKWRILGRNQRAITHIIHGDPRIEFTGFVEDAVATLAESQVAVVPVLAGSGTRIKILEAWAAATPVVSTTLGAEGLECRAGEHLLIADDPEAFADAVSAFLASPGERRRIGSAGRKLYEEKYVWPVAWKTLDAVFGNVNNRPPV
jgi:glycosyltransferase involved in cell wall biosynthesis